MKPAQTSRRPRKSPPEPLVRPFGPDRPQHATQFNLDLAQEAFIDEFACGGGASTGYYLATGRHVNFAVNHDREAVAMHRMNHPHTHHFTQDVWTLDPLFVLALLKGRRIGGAWFSPDCKHFSKAKGGALVDKRVRGLAWILKKWFGRGGAIRIAPGKRGRIHRRGPACPRVAFLENVSEFRTWGPLIAKRDPKTGRVVKRDGSVAAKGEVVPYRFQYLVPDKKRAGLYYKRLKRDAAEVGGTWDDRDIRASNHGAPTIRNRMYGICRFDGQPTIWPDFTHAAPEALAATSGALKPWATIAECLDFTLACPSIFLSAAQARQMRIKRPLKHATLARMAQGVERFVMNAERPFLINLTHVGGDRTESIDQPAMTITGANRGEKGLVAPLLAHTAHGEADKSGKKRGRGAHSVRETMPTTTASNDLAAVVARLARPEPAVNAVSILKLRGDPSSHAASHGVDEPAHTISAGGQHLGLLAASLARPAKAATPTESETQAIFIAQNNGGVNGHQTYGHPPTEPASTISSRGSQQSVIAVSVAAYYGTDQDTRLDAPAPTITTRDRWALQYTYAAIPPLTPELAAKARIVAAFLRSHGVKVEGEFAMAGDLVIYDIGMRMLTPRELFRCQGFPESYIIDRGMDEDKDGNQFEIRLTKTAQVKMVGNSVSPMVAAALIAANLPEMIVHRLAA